MNAGIVIILFSYCLLTTGTNAGRSSYLFRRATVFHYWSSNILEELPPPPTILFLHGREIPLHILRTIKRSQREMGGGG